MTYPTIMPAITLDFQNSQQLDPRVTFSRTQATAQATYINSAGQVAYAAEHEPRFDHDPVTGECLGLLIEEARTNLLLNSATLSTQSATVTATSTTLSFYGTGTVTLTGVSTAGPLVGTGASNRVSLTFTPTAGSLTLTVSGSVTNAQLEAGSFPTSYIPTAGSTATRSQDLAQVDTADIYGDEFTIINKPFGVSSGGDTLYLKGYPYIERAAVYNENLSQQQINFVANKESNNFWRWRVLGSSFALPDFRTDGQVTVDWGDGTIEVMTTAEHTFTNGGGYHDVGFRLDSGTYFQPRMSNNSTHDQKPISTGPAPESMKLDAERALQGCTNLQAFDAMVDTSSGDNFYRAWRDCASLTSFPLIDTSSGTNLKEAWYNCSSLNSYPSINTSSVTNFSSAWRNCSSLTSFPLIDTSLGENFSGTWTFCSSLTSFPLLDTSSNTNFLNTWNGCSSLNSFPSIDTSSGTNFASAWRNCSSLTSFPLIDTSSGTDFNRAWDRCSSLTSFPANMFDTWTGTPENQCFHLTWSSCSSLTPASVVNILDSIAASNVSAPSGTGTNDKNIKIDWDGTGTPATTSAAAITALKSRNWIIYLNGVLQ